MGGISSAGKKTIEMFSSKRLKKTLMQVAQKRSDTRRPTIFIRLRRAEE
jgi:hypothetical protein